MIYYRRKWKFIVYSVIIQKYQKLLLGKKIGALENFRWKWRIGFNHFSNKQYLEASQNLDFCCLYIVENADSPKLNALHIDFSFIFLTCGRCFLQLFLLQKDRVLLEISYKYYQHAIENMNLDLYAMFRLPQILVEFGRLLELYGAFESSLEIYSHILKNFPTSRVYFDAMYRSAVVGKYISDLSNGVKQKETSLSQCIDIFQFLLEALPSSINEVNEEKLVNLFYKLYFLERLYYICPPRE